ncbi:MAG: aminotransferase class IV [Kosmotogaceae bacterium]
MQKSADFFGISFPYDSDYLRNVIDELIEINGIYDGELYVELTRGTDLFREHRYQKSYDPTFFILTSPLRNIDPKNRVKGASVFTYPDLRHKLCEHKTINLLPNVLAKNYAYDKGGYEALMYREDKKGKYITEGGSSNYFIVKNEVIFTPEIDNILPGITREKVIKLAKKMGYSLVEKRVYLDEVFDADEMFLVSTVSKIMPVKSIDNEHVYSFRETVTELMSEFENTYID